ncbi:hypothetical protein JCGZ_18777 [Jatropha curcas]|uniref:NADP-dependent oxidoreductase domain-containing protein n=1 Tax=Jatropha curcas TaxID=180498 RepID=A0A067LLB1_JATCU|nr:hypothetical protein JCGZ_18777 [Jatropha curcas]
MSNNFPQLLSVLDYIALLKFFQLKGIHVSAYTPLGVPACSPGTSDSEWGEDEPGTPRISFESSTSVDVLKFNSDVKYRT